MTNFAMILMASLPTSWKVVGGVLIVVTLVAVVLSVIKAREAGALKKEVEELRDTIRMMRYEETNLSRMLHTAGKYPEPMEQGEETGEENTEIAEITEEPVIAETAETPEEPEISEKTERTEEIEGIEETEKTEFSKDSEETVETEEAERAEVPEETEVTGEAVSTEAPGLPEPPQEKEPPRKQAINERRPAIPTDLFAAWFEENEQVQEAAPAEAMPVATEPIAPTMQTEEVAESTEHPDYSEGSETAENLATEAPTIVASTAEKEQSATTLAADQTQEAATPIALGKEDERFCRKLERIVNSRMKNPNLNIDIIAAQFGIGRTNFYRKVRELMGISPNDYLRKCRMERAAELLCNSELPIADVCAQVGIPDAQYFSRVFKSYFGTPPSTYREQKSNG